MVLPLTNIVFIIFLGLALIWYWAFHNHVSAQNWILLVSSYFFYGFGDWLIIPLLFGTTLFNYVIGIYIERYRANSKKVLLRIAVGCNLCVLGIFKYFNFFTDSFTKLFAYIGINLNPLILTIILPVGISFFTFQVISYQIEIFRGSIPATRDFIAFAVYVAYFPKLIAGPIEPPREFISQITQKRRLTWDKGSSAFQLIVLGYFKKIVIADMISNYINPFYDDPTIFGSIDALVIIWLYTIQIYADFSGYTDIVRGVSKLMGIELIENFAQPYLARNPQDFWRRWHISLMLWFRNYLYIPLGGNKKRQARTYTNIMIVFLLTGLWHGAGYGFLVWGLLHGFYLVCHRFFLQLGKQKNFDLQKTSRKTRTYLPRIYQIITLNLICFSWIFFRAADIEAAAVIYSRIFQNQELSSNMYNTLYLLMILISMSILLISLDRIQERKKTHEIFSNLKWYWQGILLALLILSSIGFLFTATTPFIYAGF